MPKINGHKIEQGDVTKGDLAKLMGNQKADVVCCDPPWDNGWVAQFRKKAGVALEGQDFEFFIGIFLKELLKYAEGIIYLEMGKKNWDRLLEVLKFYGYTTLNTYEIPYGKSTSYIWRGTCNGRTFKTLDKLPVDLKGEKIFEWLLNQDKTEGGILLDPCIGTGRSYHLAKRVNMFAWGLELQQSKVDILTDKIERDTNVL